MAEPVTMQQLTDWVEKNKHRTWNHDSMFKSKKRSSFEIKYIDFTLDTRDMKVFGIRTRSFADLAVDFREDFDGNILELLEQKLEKWNEKKT